MSVLWCYDKVGLQLGHDDRMIAETCPEWATYLAHRVVQRALPIIIIIIITTTTTTTTGGLKIAYIIGPDFID